MRRRSLLSRGLLVGSLASLAIACTPPDTHAPDRRSIAVRWGSMDATDLFDPGTLPGSDDPGASRAEAGRLASRLWKFEGDLEWRSGLLAHPGAPVEWRLLVPSDATLETACRTMNGELGFRLSLSLPGEAARELARRGAGECGSEAPDWTPVEVDLRPWEGREAVLTFEVIAETQGAWGAWAEPVVTVPDRTGFADVLLVSLDTTRADRLSVYRPELDTTPFLGEWAKREAVVFERAVAAAPWTFPSHVSMLTGIDALRHGCYDNQDRTEVPRLQGFAARLRANGYRVLAVTGGGLLQPSLGFHYGFERYAFWDRRAHPHEELGSGLERVGRWLDLYRGERLALFFHTYEPHVPNIARDPDELARRGIPVDVEIGGRIDRPSPENGFFGQPTFIIRTLDDGEWQPTGPDDRGTIEAYYDSALRHVDDGLARLLPEFDARSARPGLVVVTSDHGESLGEHDRIAHGQMYDSNLHVPLIVRLPGLRQAGRRVGGLVSAVDILPTVLEALGLPAAGGLDGRSLLAATGGEPTGREWAWSYSAAQNRGAAAYSSDGWKAVVADTAWRSDRWWGGLFELESDPEELVDRSASDPARWEEAVRIVRRAALARLPGLRLSFTSLADATVALELQGESLAAHLAKSVRDPGLLEWDGERRGRLTLGPREERALSLLGVHSEGTDLSLRLRASCGAASEHSLRFRDLATAEARPHTFEVPSCPGALPAGFVRVSSSWNPSPSDLSEVSPASGEGFDEAQLRALGYL